jgi:MFS family permease
VVSPLISGYLIETTGWRNVFLVGSAINFLSIIPGLMIKSRNKQDREESNIRIRDVLDRGTGETLTIFFIYGTLMTTALGAINLIIPLYLDSFFSLSASQIGLFFTAQSFLNLITQIPSGRLADRFGKKKTVLTLIAPLPFMFAAWHFIGNWTWLLVINSLAFGLWSMTWPALLALLSDSVPDEAVGVAFGINTTGNRLGFTIGPLVASYFYINYSKTTPFLVAGTITLIAVLFAFKLKDRVRERKLLI